jgi:4-diphosphocytidyl-2-C-methyl-D-erythritol kinase
MISLEAPAKLTLSLRITGVRDDGFHTIDAEMVALSLADIVHITPSNSIHISATGRFSDGIPTDESNLVHRALSLVERTADVLLEKNIPHGGGLGGGSTDAAAVLRWAEFFRPTEAARLGADVAFSLFGGRAHVSGIGEVVEPLPHIDRDLTLFVPPVHVSTPLVYKTWDQLGGPVGDQENDLEPAAIAAVPELAKWRDRITESFGTRPQLAGSGATWFANGHLTPQRETPEGLVVVHTTTRPDAGRVVA